MAQIPILRGIYSDAKSDFRISYPRNLEPVPLDTGLSTGYLRPADGIIEFGIGPGYDRGGINWNGKCYRVMGTKLVRIESDGAVTILGDVGGAGPVTLDYSFDHLGIASGGNLFLWDGGVLTQVTDVDLGTCIDFCWIDGYFLSTDGEFLVVTELTDPFSVNPLKYASSEADPDPVKALRKLRSEAYVANRYTVEVFQNIGGTLFPFQRVEGAQLQRGAVGTQACAIFLDRLAFIGSGRNEALAIWLGSNGMTDKISTREVELLLGSYTEAQLENALVEARMSAGQNLLYIHLPDRTVVYNHEASLLTETHVWYTVDSGSSETPAQYRANHFVRCYDKWLVGDPFSSKHGYLSETVSSHYGEKVRWEFGTQVAYAGGKRAIVHRLELVALTGRAAFGDDPTIFTQYSSNGETWSMPRGIKAGKQGERDKRLVWLQQGLVPHWRIQRFFGDSTAHASFARLEAEFEPLES